MILVLIMVGFVLVALFVFFWTLGVVSLVFRRINSREILTAKVCLAFSFLFVIFAFMFVGFEIHKYDYSIVMEAKGEAVAFNSGSCRHLEEIDRAVRVVSAYNDLVYRGKEHVGVLFDGVFTRKFADLDYLELNQELLSKVISKDYLVS